MPPCKDGREPDRPIVVAPAKRKDGGDEVLLKHSTRSVRGGGARHEASTTMSSVGLEPAIDGGTSNRVDHRRLRDRPLKCKTHNLFPESR